MTNSRSPFRRVAIKAAKQAGAILLKYYATNVREQNKSSYYDVGSIVTVADLKAERHIVRLINRHFPEHNILAEEVMRKKTSSDYCWYIDPLDGTSNFLKKIPLWGISIGLTYKNQPIMGVLYLPPLKLLVEAEQGRGAWADGKRIKVSKRPLAKALQYAGSKYQGKFQIKPQLFKKVAFIKMVGASCFELAQIARGQGEIYLHERPKLHDVVAGICIVREADGKVTDERGRDWQLNSRICLVTNKAAHRETLQVINRQSKSYIRKSSPL